MEKLGSSLKDVLRKIANASHVDQKLIKEIVRDIQRALLQSDVNVKLALELTKEIERRALSEKPKAGMAVKEHVIKIVYDELVDLIGEKREIGLEKKVIMMVGLYGQGKTTTAGKLARHFKKKGQNVGLVAGDVHRPAAFDQLKQIGEMIDVPVFGVPGEKNAAKIVKAGLGKFADYDVVILDTSGRHSLEKDLINEIKTITKVAKPDEKILIVDASMGQQAGPQAKAFHDAVGVTGVIITKLDGSAKGGGAISAVSETKASILFIGTGEHIEDIEAFDPSRFISRLLGMGDIRSLIEKADHEKDHVRQIHPHRNARPDGNADQHGPPEETHGHDARRPGATLGRGHGGHAGKIAHVQDNHELDDPGGADGPQERQILQDKEDSQGQRH